MTVPDGPVRATDSQVHAGKTGRGETTWNVTETTIWRDARARIRAATARARAASVCNIIWPTKSCRVAVFRLRPRERTTAASRRSPGPGDSSPPGRTPVARGAKSIGRDHPGDPLRCAPRRCDAAGTDVTQTAGEGRTFQPSFLVLPTWVAYSFGVSPKRAFAGGQKGLASQPVPLVWQATSTDGTTRCLTSPKCPA